MQVKRIARIIKEANPEALIVCGGYLTAASNTVLRKTDVDVCVVGDGEIAWTGLLDYSISQRGKNNKVNVEKLLKIRGISVLDNNELKFSGYGQTLSSCDMSFPSFEYLKTGLQGDNEALKNYFRHFSLAEEFLLDERSFEKHRRPMSTSIHTSKGCVAKCTFCQRGSKGYITYNLDDLEKHLIELKEFNVGFLSVDDENFGSNKKYTYEVAKIFHKHDMLWNATGVRCTSVTKEDLQFYKDHGCSSIKFGIESGSQTMLDVMEKKFEVDDIKKALFNCYEIGLYSPPLGFMVGMPGETLETAKASGRFLGEIATRLRVPVSILFKYVDIFYAIPLVGTPLYDYGKNLKLIGNTVEEEEAFLKLVSNIGAYKRYYINFNGAPMSEVVFWDMLVFLEATRTYVHLMKNKTVDLKLYKKLKDLNERQSMNPHSTIKDKEKFKKEAQEVKGMQIFGGGGGDDKTHKFNQNFISNFIKKNIAFNDFLARWCPRFLLYPLVRYSLFIEYNLQKFLIKDTNNIHIKTNSKVNKNLRIEQEYLNPTTTKQIDRSLRSIVKKKFPELIIQKKLDPAKSLTGGP